MFVYDTFLWVFTIYVTIHMMFFFLCDAAIYLLKYYSNVRTIVLFVHLATFESKCALLMGYN